MIRFRLAKDYAETHPSRQYLTAAHPRAFERYKDGRLSRVALTFSHGFPYGSTKLHHGERLQLELSVWDAYVGNRLDVQKHQ